MTRVVSYGHWVVALFFLVLGLDVLGSSVAEIPGLLRKHPQEVTYVVVMHAFIWLAGFLCAWGVFKWRAWSRTLGIVLCAFFGVIALGVSIYFRSGIHVNWALLLMGLVSCSVFVWLLLPSVRAEYSRRNQIA